MNHSDEMVTITVPAPAAAEAARNLSIDTRMWKEKGKEEIAERCAIVACALVEATADLPAFLTSTQ